MPRRSKLLKSFIITGLMQLLIQLAKWNTDAERI